LRNRITIAVQIVLQIYSIVVVNKNFSLFLPSLFNNKKQDTMKHYTAEVVDDFMAAGVDHNDIFLGFVPPSARHFLGFAVA
jgi:XisI protein